MGTIVFSQREAANWYFGKNAGLDFNSGTPEFLLDGLINTVEGCEVFSDANGNLLFYTDGKTVWDKRHEVMPDGLGLKGSHSTSQSALVIPNPVNKNIYYVFTPDDALSQNESGNTNGFNYSTLDLSRNGGYGDVVEKNVELLPQGSEKVSAVRNASGDFYWVVTQFRNQFYAFRVDENGVDRTPVVSTIGPWIEDFENIRGNIKVSPDGTRLAISHTIVEPEYEGSFYLCDFDVATGRVSNSQLVSDSRLYYGVEFSADSSKLYASGIDFLSFNGTIALGNIQLVQFDLTSPNFGDEEYLIGDFPNKLGVIVAGALQIGIDKKIYHAIPGNQLSVIRTPNLKGINVDFRPFAVDLGGREATYGLPPYIQSFFETIVTIENFCEGNKTTFTTDSTGGIASISWNFGDINSGTANFSNELNPTHIFSSHGTYTVTMEVEYVNGTTRSFIEFVEIAESPDVVTEVELVQCDVDGVDDGISAFNLMEAIPLFSNGNEDITGLFFANEGDALNNVNQLEPVGYVNTMDGQVIYARAFENAECYSIVEIELSVEPLSYLDTYDTLYLCNGFFTGLSTKIDLNEVYNQLLVDFEDYGSLSLFANRENALLEQEQLEIGEYTFGPLDFWEIYFRVEEANRCAFIGKVLLNISERPEFEPLVQVNLCNGVAALEALQGFDSYLWPNGTISDILLVKETGIVDVAFGSGPCSYIQTFEVLPEKEIDIAEILVEDFSRANSLTIALGPDEEESELLFSIDGGTSFQASSEFRDLIPGIYNVVVDNNCTTFEKEVMVGGMPAFFTPNGDDLYDDITLHNPEYFPNYKMSIFDRYGKLLKSFSGQQNGWDGTYLNQEMPAGNYWYLLELSDGRTVKGFFALKR